MRILLIGVLAAAVLTDQAAAQRLAEYTAAGPSIAEHQPPTAVLPAPVPPIAVYPAVPALPAMPPFGGDGTFDNITGLHWFTNGATVATQPTPTFPPAGPMVGPVAFPGAVLAAIGGGPVTGIAIDPAAGILYVTNALGIVVPVGAVPALPIVAPPFPIAGIAGPVTGLEWDGATGTVYAVNAAGVVWQFFVGGAPAAPPLPPPIAMPGPAGDLAIDKTLQLNGVGLRPLYVVAGASLFDVRLPAPLLFPAAMPGSQGLAFIDHPAAVPPAGACLCPGTTGPVNITSGPMATGNLGWTIGMTGLAPFGFGIFAFDTVWNPAFPLVNVVGCPLGLFVPSPSLILMLGIANAAGTVIFPLGLGAPIGAGPLYNQNATFCPADPTGFVFTPLQVIDVGGL